MKYKNIIFNNTLEKYNKRYRHHKNLLKLTKNEVETFDELYNAKGEYRLLKHNNWWLIGDTYYQVPKALHHYWFRNLNIGVQAVTCLLGAGIVATAATLPFVLNNVKKDESEDVFIDPTLADIAKIEVLRKTNDGVYYKVSPKDSSKKKITAILSVYIGNDKLNENTEYTYNACNKTESDSIELLIKQVAFSSHSGPVKVLPKVEPKITKITVTDMEENPITETILGINETINIMILGSCAGSEDKMNVSNFVIVGESSCCTITKKEGYLEILRNSEGEETITFSDGDLETDLKVKNETAETTITVEYDEETITKSGLVLSNKGVKINQQRPVSFHLVNNTETDLTFDIVGKVDGNVVYRSSQSLIANGGTTYSIKSSDITGFESLTEDKKILISVELKTTSIHTDLGSTNLFLKPGESKKLKILDNNNQNVTSTCVASGYSTVHLTVVKNDEELTYVITAKDIVTFDDKDTITFRYSETDDITCSINVTYAKSLSLTSVDTPAGIEHTGSLVGKVIQTGEDISIELKSTLDDYTAGITIKDEDGNNKVFEDYILIKNGESTIKLKNTSIDWKNVNESTQYKIYINGIDVTAIHTDCGTNLGIHPNDTFTVKVLDQNNKNVSGYCKTEYTPGEDILTINYDSGNEQFNIKVANSITTVDYTRLYFIYENGGSTIRTNVYIEFLPRELNVNYDNLNKLLGNHSFVITTCTNPIQEYINNKIVIKFKSKGGLTAGVTLRLSIKDKSGNELENIGKVNFHSTCDPVTIEFTEFSKTYHNQDIYIHAKENFDI